MKTCSKCKRELPLGCFVKSDRYRDGKYPSCKDCRKEKRDARLASNPVCITCKVEPHMKGNPYCRTCLRIINDLPLERKRPNVDRNNKTMCCRCKVNPRARGCHYCDGCRNDMNSEWYNRHGKEYRTREDSKVKQRARQFVHWKVEQGAIQKRTCEVCGNPKVQAHHHKGYDDFNRLDVVWLCLDHHLEAERAMKKDLTNGQSVG